MLKVFYTEAYASGRKPVWKTSCLCRASSTRLSLFLCRDHARDDGGQYRARRQLLAAVSEVPLARFSRLRGYQPLDAIPFAFDLLWRACRPLRLPKDCPVCPDPVHECIGSMGHT